jgi:hypothetical protein
MRFLDVLRRLLNEPESPGASSDELSPQALGEMMKCLQNTQDVEMFCDEVLAFLDQFAEAQLHVEDVTSLLPLVQHRLEMCLDCQEEYEALLRILQAQPG